MKQFFALFLIGTALFSSSCSKDNALIEDISGTWKLSARKENGVMVDVSRIDEKVTYTSCNQKKEDKCPAKYALVDSSSVGTRITANFDYTYSVDAKNDKLTEMGLATVVKTIVSYSSSKLEVKYMDGNVTTEDTYTK
jgi:hypothetical protein